MVTKSPSSIKACTLYLDPRGQFAEIETLSHLLEGNFIGTTNWRHSWEVIYIIYFVSYKLFLDCAMYSSLIVLYLYIMYNNHKLYKAKIVAEYFDI